MVRTALGLPRLVNLSHALCIADCEPGVWKRLHKWRSGQVRQHIHSICSHAVYVKQQGCMSLLQCSV